ncbi:hypothetical protein [Methylobacterium sp. A54F]
MDMNPVAVAVMLGIGAVWLGLLVGVLYLGHPVGLGSFVVLTIAMFVRWGRLG